MSFSSLEKKSTNYEEMKQKLAGSEERAETFQPGTDAANNGYARIRFLPAVEGYDHWISYIRWEYKKGSKSYREKSLRSIGKPDPVQDYRNALYNASSDERMSIKKKNVNACYVYVYEDKAKPENNGKVLLYYMPKTILDMIETAIKPEEDSFADVQPQPFNPFDIFGSEGRGRDFVIRIKNKDGYRNYTDSHFADESSCWFNDDNKSDLEKMWIDGVESLTPMIEESQFKTYDQLLKQLVEVVGIDAPYLQDTFGDQLEKLNNVQSNNSTTKSDQETKAPDASDAVSYTHLTLPTIYSV